MNPKHRKLNKRLDPDRFWIKLRSRYRLILDDYRVSCDKSCEKPTSDDCRRCLLHTYLEDLGRPSEDKTVKEVCITGSTAVEHARRVHAKVRRQLLRFDNVTAVDVGFAVEERKKEFTNCLAIRIHVGTKHPVSYLRRKGIANPTDPRHALVAALAQIGERHETPGQDRRDDDLERDLGCERYPRYPIAGVSHYDLGCLPYPSKWIKQLEEYAKEGAVRKADRHQGETPGPDGGLLHRCECCRRWCPCRCKICHACCLCCCCEDCKTCCHCWPCACRLTICGVPLDIVQANYFPSTRHPGGDYDQGVFADALTKGRELGDEELLLTGRGKVSPLVGGVSVGSVHGQAGTLGAVVWDETDGSPCALGNWHVLAGSATAHAGQPCYQPASFDGGCGDAVIGHLKRWHLGELGDAALAELDGSREFASGEILGLWHPISGYQSPELNLEIRKWGRTTGFSKGFIDGIHLATDVDYGNGLVRHFEHQFHIAPLFAGRDVSQVGDSGSLVVTSYDLNDLEVVARGVLRTRQPEEPGDQFKEALRGLISKGDFDELEELASKIRKLLEKHPFPGPEKECEPYERPKDRQAEHANPDLSLALKLCREEDLTDGEKNKAEELHREFTDLVRCLLDKYGIEVEEFLSKKKAKKDREVRNVYYAVGMIFAGDTPGSPFGEFALASDISLLAKDMRFSLRPLFEPRSSFRKLRTRPPVGGYRSAQRGIPREPGAQGADPRGQGPQPEGEQYQSGSGGTGGTGGGGGG